MKFVPHKYQERAIEMLLKEPFSGLFLRPGYGKTSCVLATLKLLKRREMMRGALILAPLRPTYSVWPAELGKWDDFSKLTYTILHGPDKDRRLAERRDLYLMNYDGLPWLARTLSKMKVWPFDVLVSDESTRLKHTNTRRFKILKPMLGRFKRRHILSGTPAPNGLLDLFGQAYVMDQGLSLGKYVTHYRDEFFYSTGFGGYTWLPKPGAEKAIHAKLAPRVMTFTDKEVVKLPPLTINDLYVDLSPSVKVTYNQMEYRLRIDFMEGRVTAANAAIASLKCRQIANGGIYLDGEERKWTQIHTAKSDAVAELVEELSGEPALIAYDFQHDLDRLRKSLKPIVGGDIPYIGGGVSTKRSKELVEAWNKGELPVLLGQPQSIAHGLNLQSAGRTVIWASLTWNYEDYDQFISRIHRQGQTRPVVVHRIIARDTVDEVIIKALEAKGKTENRLMNALKEYWKK